jgi:hypothetical protein
MKSCECIAIARLGTTAQKFAADRSDDEYCAKAAVRVTFETGLRATYLTLRQCERTSSLESVQSPGDW